MTSDKNFFIAGIPSEKFEGCTIHTYNDGDLIACFDEDIPDNVIKEIAKRQPLRGAADAFLANFADVRITRLVCLAFFVTGFRQLHNMTDVYYSAGEYDQGMLDQLVSNIKPDRNDLDLLFGCLLEWGLPCNIRKECFINLFSHALPSSQNLHSGIRGQHFENLAHIDFGGTVGKAAVPEHSPEGESRAKYGRQIIKNLSEAMNKQFGRGFSADTLENARKFYQTYQDRISETVFRKFAVEKSETVFRLFEEALPFTKNKVYIEIFFSVSEPFLSGLKQVSLSEFQQKFLELVDVKPHSQDGVSAPCSGSITPASTNGLRSAGKKAHQHLPQVLMSQLVNLQIDQHIAAE